MSVEMVCEVQVENVWVEVSDWKLEAGEELQQSGREGAKNETKGICLNVDCPYRGSCTGKVTLVDSYIKGRYASSGIVWKSGR